MFGQQIKRFIAVGLAGTALNYALFFVLFRLVGVHYVAANVAGYVAGVLFGYAYNRKWTFSSVITNRAKEVSLYFGVYLFSLASSVVALRLLVEIAGVPPLVANVLPIGISAALNFLGLKFLVFHAAAQKKLARIAPYLTPAFFAIGAVKIVSSALFASHFVTTGFLPFVDFFARTLENPYQHFLGSATIPFPYPGGMLFLFSLPFVWAQNLLPAALLENLNFNLLLFRLPILAADVLIYLVLCLLLPTKEKKVLWLYFASPILFYINYFHGQLDAVPTALLFASLFFLFRKKEVPSFLLLGIGIAAKTHLLAALPFGLIYLWRNRVSAGRIAGLAGLALAAFMVLNPFFSSEGFSATVFNNPEQERLFSLFVPFGFKDLRFFLAPAAILLVLFRFASYQKHNPDSLLLVLGLIYTALISLVPPMPGWFYWSLPFVILFFVKYKGAPSVSLWALNVFYILYFVFTKDSDIFQSLAPVLPQLAAIPAPFALLAARGIDAALLESLFFTALEASLIMSIFWSWKVGVASNALFQEKKKSVVIGIAGDSGVGKTTLGDALQGVVGAAHAVVVRGDDMHKWERGHHNWKLYTHLNPKANFVHIDLAHALTLMRGEHIERAMYDHSTGRFTKPVAVEAKPFIIFDGLLTLLLEEMRSRFDLKIYVEAADEVRVGWKVARDQAERGHTAETVTAQIDGRRPDAEKFIHPQKQFADWHIKYYRPAENDSLHTEYAFRNSVAAESLVEELNSCPALSAEHQYPDMYAQKVIISGSIGREKIKEIAYKLFPNLLDLVENEPVFDDGILGIHQLFFINLLDNFYKLRLEKRYA